MVTFLGNLGHYHALYWSCGKGRYLNAYFEKDNSASTADQTVEDTAVTDANLGKSTPRNAKQLPRHRRLLAETELCRIFEGIAEQPLPKELLDLLQRIDARLGIEGAG